MGSDVVEVKALPFDRLTEDQRVEFIPGQIFDLKKNEPAFIFNRENLKAIKRYERAVLKLPEVLDDQECETLSALGLNAGDVESFYKNLRNHVGSWDHIEDACKTMGADLQIFAENLIAESGDMISKIKQTSAWEDVVVTANVKISNGEKITLRDIFDNHLKTIADDIAGQLEGIREVKALVDVFGDTIREKLQPEASSLLDRIARVNVSDELVNLQLKIVFLNTDIDRKTEEYFALVGSAFSGLVFGPLGLAVTGGIYGPQAASLNAEHKELTRQRDKFVERKVLLQGGASGIESMSGHVRDISFRLAEVGAAIKNLEDVWVLLEAYANNSIKQMERVSTQLELRRFVGRFQRVIKPWGSILGISKDVSRLFNDVLKKY